MLKKMPIVMIVFCLAVVLSLGGCGGSGGGSGDSSSVGGVVVDPYIAGAEVEEIGAGGQVLQTATTNAQGAYRFEKQLSGGSLLQLKSGSLGQHVGASYRVRLSRLFVEGDAEPIVISPLTTLLSAGVSADELNAALASAGLSDLGQSRLYSDPMAGLGALTEVTDAQLETLQAAMAAGSYLDIVDSEAFDGQLLEDCLSAVTTLLNADTFAQVKSALAADQDIATLTLEDLIHATVIDVRDLVDEVKAGKLGTESMAAEATGRLDNLATVTKNKHLQRMAGSSGSGISGQLVFENECANCHNISDGGTMDLSGKGDLIAGSHRAGSLRSEEIPALASYLDGITAPPATSESNPTPTGGEAVFSAKCGTCHTISGGGTMDLSGKGDLIAGSHRAGSLRSEEIPALASYLDGITAPPATSESNPTPTGGEAVFSAKCGTCHTISGGGTMDLSGKGDLIAGSHGASSLTTEEISALATFLNQDQTASENPDTGTGTSNCTSCHGQPPDGSIFPNTAGAHAAHLALQENSVECGTCHQGATHNDSIELVFPPAYDAQGNVATDNLDGTCSSIICHGVETTPDWWAGNIDVNTQCTSCHQSGNDQYNSYSSGEHGEHDNYACTVCHNTAKMTGHFGDLSTVEFETDPATTIGGGATSVGSYNGTSCSSIACHDDDGDSHADESW